MELRQLRYFVTVVEEANFTRAAARLHLAQPGLSAQIRQLERELGQPLLDRSGRTVTPTAAGAAVLPHARAALAAAERVRETVDEFTGLLRGHIRLGTISGVAMGEFDIADVLAGFHADHPQVEITLTETSSDAMLADLERGALDIALVGLTGQELDPRLSLDIVLDVAIVAAVAAEDPDRRDRIALTELRDRPLICLTRGTGVRGVLERRCAAAGFEPDVAYEAAAPPLLLRLAARGLGLAVVPELTPAEAAAVGVRTMAIVEPELRGRLALAWRTDRLTSPAAKVLLGQLRIALARRKPMSR
ncbi:LysR substrate-binding domain-containing protein [Nocardia sp. CDC159]|uniref:LysR substrate-binding domain-containing protein n=1 Tax=Nocardia pulmonis TaxID=2951408 RepID=A0A9X2EEC8_9NOCA|nr:MULTISPECIES: LysR substrate-binding domain-containing protein [Nocardia]MCM6778790.1 LysR substrate-binding domain-containing protein [Nocardia pulmonis]MCM6791679.1 LysR substrate-binding domain-containing protein [Nocardia sp. CDC159]